MDCSSGRLGRRALLASVAALAAAGSSAPVRAAVSTRARIVILGAGAAGLATAGRLSRRLEGAKITLVDSRKEHLYQPSFTLVATGLKSPGYVIGATADFVPPAFDGCRSRRTRSILTRGASPRPRVRASPTTT